MIFSCSVFLQILIACGIILILGPLCVWFISTYMHIPNGDYLSAYWVLGFTIATFCISLLSIPYNAVIISHENMRFFSYMSILEVCLKLGIAYCVSIFIQNRVIMYAALLFIVSIIIQLSYYLFCRVKFEECRVAIDFDRNIFKELGSFAGWNFFGDSFRNSSYSRE